jgi:prepilin-type N-terminal cleavage/methylation domain-containing protein
MKNTKKAFTLVELIVVITILAVLATVAFISFSGQTKEANKSKVLSDLNTLSSAINIATQKVSLKSIVDTTDTNIATRNRVISSTVFSGATLDESLTSYSVGTVNFVSLGQNGEDFKDSKGNEYLIAVYASGSTLAYQVAAEVEDAAGDNIAYVKGSYYQAISADAEGLLSYNGNTASGVTNEQILATASFY